MIAVEVNAPRHFCKTWEYPVGVRDAGQVHDRQGRSHRLEAVEARFAESFDGIGVVAAVNGQAAADVEAVEGVDVGLGGKGEASGAEGHGWLIDCV